MTSSIMDKSTALTLVEDESIVADDTYGLCLGGYRNGYKATTLQKLRAFFANQLCSLTGHQNWPLLIVALCLLISVWIVSYMLFMERNFDTLNALINFFKSDTVNIYNNLKRLCTRGNRIEADILDDSEDDPAVVEEVQRELDMQLSNDSIRTFRIPNRASRNNVVILNSLSSSEDEDLEMNEMYLTGEVDQEGGGDGPSFSDSAYNRMAGGTSSWESEEEELFYSYNTVGEDPIIIDDTSAGMSTISERSVGASSVSTTNTQLKDGTAANDTAENDTDANDTAANDTAANNTAANDTVANDTAANDTVANDTAANDTAGVNTEIVIPQVDKNDIEDTNIEIAENENIEKLPSPTVNNEIPIIREDSPTKTVRSTLEKSRTLLSVKREKTYASIPKTAKNQKIQVANKGTHQNIPSNNVSITEKPTTKPTDASKYVKVKITHGCDKTKPSTVAPLDSSNKSRPSRKRERTEIIKLPTQSSEISRKRVQSNKIKQQELPKSKSPTKQTGEEKKEQQKPTKSTFYRAPSPFVRDKSKKANQSMVDCIEKKTSAPKPSCSPALRKKLESKNVSFTSGSVTKSSKLSPLTRCRTEDKTKTTSLNNKTNNNTDKINDKTKNKINERTKPMPKVCTVTRHLPETKKADEKPKIATPRKRSVANRSPTPATEVRAETGGNKAVKDRSVGLARFPSTLKKSPPVANRSPTPATEVRAETGGNKAVKDRSVGLARSPSTVKKSPPVTSRSPTPATENRAETGGNKAIKDRSVGLARSPSTLKKSPPVAKRSPTPATEVRAETGGDKAVKDRSVGLARFPSTLKKSPPVAKRSPTPATEVRAETGGNKEIKDRSVGLARSPSTLKKSPPVANRSPTPATEVRAETGGNKAVKDRSVRLARSPSTLKKSPRVANRSPTPATEVRAEAGGNKAVEDRSVGLARSPSTSKKPPPSRIPRTDSFSKNVKNKMKKTMNDAIGDTIHTTSRIPSTEKIPLQVPSQINLTSKIISRSPSPIQKKNCSTTFIPSHIPIPILSCELTSPWQSEIDSIRLTTDRSTELVDKSGRIMPDTSVVSSSTENIPTSSAMTDEYIQFKESAAKLQNEIHEFDEIITAAEKKSINTLIDEQKQRLLSAKQEVLKAAQLELEEEKNLPLPPPSTDLPDEAEPAIKLKTKATPTGDKLKKQKFQKERGVLKRCTTVLEKTPKPRLSQSASTRASRGASTSGGSTKKPISILSSRSCNSLNIKPNEADNTTVCKKKTVRIVEPHDIPHPK